MKVTLALADRTMPEGGFDLVGVRMRGGDVVLRALGADVVTGTEMTLTIVLTGEEWAQSERAVAELRSLHAATVVSLCVHPGCTLPFGHEEPCESRPPAA